MKQTIEIEVPEGKRAVLRDDKIIYEDIVPKLPETWDEFCELYFVYSEWIIGGASDAVNIECNHRDPKTSRNILPSKKSVEAHLALMQLHQLRDCYRQGWIPDWNNSCDKYCIDFTDDINTIRRYNHHPYFLSFQSQEIAEKFLENFKDLIRQAGDLI